MIRTRDLYVFTLILLFLSVCIAVTILLDVRAFSHKSAFLLLDTNVSSTTFSANATLTRLNREENISRLRKAILENDSVIIPNPSVTEVVETTDNVSTSTHTTAVMTVQRCAEPDDAISYTRTWPLDDVFVVVKDGYRSVVEISKTSPSLSSVGTTTASSTQPSVTIKTHLKLQENPLQSGNTYCVPSDVIGITLQGSLMFNADAHLYMSKTENELIGYARDGFPIYGVYEGAVDSCGGYMHALGYRYTLSKDRTYVLGCYVGSPAVFETF